jgi:hypothetical protein
MTVQDLLLALMLADVCLFRRGDRLVVNAPDDPLSPELLATLQLHKPTLLAVLGGDPLDAEQVAELVRANGLLEWRDTPAPPPDAKFWLCDESGRECEPGDKVYMWSWEGGPGWFYAKQYPLPIAVG